jgi:hypothetical protein
MSFGMKVDTIFIDDTPFHGIENVELNSNIDTLNDNKIFTVLDTKSATLTMKSRISKSGYLLITGVFNAIMEVCPNRKVKHLALYGKRKTRKKNLNRIIRMLEKEARNEQTF